jgi:hypothetical protein
LALASIRVVNVVMNSATTAYPTVAIDLVTVPVITLGVYVADTVKEFPIYPVATFTISVPEEASVDIEISELNRVFVLYGFMSPETVSVNDCPLVHTVLDASFDIAIEPEHFRSAVKL